MKIGALLGLLLSFGIGHIGGQRAEQYSHEGFLFSVEVSLSETNAPAILGIREGQTVAEVRLNGVFLLFSSCSLFISQGSRET